MNFDDIEIEERERNCSTRGGLVEVKSRERALQEQRELSTLMVIYTSAADIPSSPREPSDPYTGEHSQEIMFGTPHEKTKVLQCLLSTSYSVANYKYKAREIQYHTDMTSQRQPAQSSAPGMDLMALLSTLNAGQQQAPQPPPQQQLQPQLQPQPIAQAPQTEIEKIFAQFSGGQRQPVPQPQMQQTPAIPPAFDLQNALAALTQANHSQPQQPAQTQLSQMQALLAQMGQQPVTQLQGYGYPNQYQGDYDRKRSAPGWGDTDGQNDYGGGDLGYANNKRQKAAKDKKRVCPTWDQ